MSDHVENTPAEGVNPQVTEQVIPESQEGAGEAANLNADSQLRGEPGSENTGIETDAKPQGRAQPRIQQLIAERKRAEYERDAALRELDSLKPRPPINPADHLDNASRDEAIVERALTEGERRATQRAARLADERALAARAQAFAERVEDFRDKAPDFEAVAYSDKVKVTPVMADAIHEADNGPQIAYWLGKNTAEAARIASLSPVRQVAEIGKLEARLSTPVKRTTQAPPPPKTLAGNTASNAPNLEEMDFETYRATRMGKA